MRANRWKGLPIFTLCSMMAAAEISTERIALESFDGRSMPAELGRLSVPAERRDTGRKISTAFYFLRAKNPGSNIPVVFLMGGPGVPATFIAKVPPYFELFASLAEHSPVILLDQRGTGQSTPKVDCPGGFEPPLGLFATPQSLQKVYAESYRGCARYWAARRAFPKDFSVEEIADDVEDLRAALDIPQINLLALSFGTRIGLEMIRRHPEAVHKAVLQGTVTPDGLVRLPVEMDAFFRRTAADAKAQAAEKGLDEDLEATYRNVIQTLDREPLLVPITTNEGKRITAAIGSKMFAALVATRATDTRLPALLTSVNQKDTSVIAPMLQSVYQDLQSGAGNMMGHTAPCSGTVPTKRLKLAREQLSGSLLAEPFDNLTVTDGFCHDIGFRREGRDDRTPSGEMPVLFITGDLDDRTPVPLAESAVKNFRQGRSVVIRNGGHELLVEKPVRELVTSFFESDVSADSEIALPSRTFMSVAEAAQPPRRPR
jgi:pimeloyl-ACP methyl ester carboxylesterase